MSSNRRILIDNATLSGVERIIGASKIINMHYIDNDILCLEKLITAILFSDKIIAIDDYKDEYRSNRFKNFKFIDFIKIDDNRYKDVSNEAAQFARSMTFSFKGSKPTGDVVHFFDSLRINPQLRWDIFVSSEYLTLTYLVKHTKYAQHESSIDSMFRNENNDQDLTAPERIDSAQIDDVKNFVQTLLSSNPNFKGPSHDSALSRILFGYGWAAERSYFYNSIAHLEESDVYLSPLRDSFCESCCRIDYPSQVNGLLETLKNKSQKIMSSILEPSGHAQFAIRLPFFTAYLISKTEGSTRDPG
jgi:hypothetical protein